MLFGISYRPVFRLIVVFAFLVVESALVSAGTREVVIPDRTPTDVYHLVLKLEQRVRQLRDEANVFDAWPLVSENQVGQVRAPRHVLQKSIEVLEKVNRLRQIRKVGPIAIASFPSRYVTPNEVYDRVKRLVGEVELLLKNEPIEIGKDDPLYAGLKSRYTPTDVYQKLWEISLALDPFLGIRGFTPSDVYAQTKYVVELVRFLRLTQNLPDNIPLPERPRNKHPNHALAAAYRLLGKINRAEHNLWMQPEPVPAVPRRVIRPTEVYDALQIVVAELQRIKYRLGVERPIVKPDVELGKSPDDVIQLLNWAAQAMPQFEPGHPIYQFDQRSLQRQPEDVMQVAHQVYQDLLNYQQQRGIQVRPLEAPYIQGLAPKHVYQKTLTNLDKVARLRQQVGLGATVMPDYPLHEITPNEVYELAVRLKDELALVFQISGVSMQSASSSSGREMATDVTPSQVYRQMWNVAYLLDTVLGTAGYSVGDLYNKALIINGELTQLAQHLGRWQSEALPQRVVGVTAPQVLLEAQRLLELVERTQQRAGLLSGHIPQPAVTGSANTSDLFNVMEMISTELATFKLHLGVINAASTPAQIEEPELSDVYQQLLYGQQVIQTRLLQE